jgi:hypothetical protein
MLVVQQSSNEKKLHVLAQVVQHPLGHIMMALLA